MTEAQHAYDQAGDDLVADAEADNTVEHVVRQRDTRRLGDVVAAEQRQLHTDLALGDAVTHGRHAAGYLPRAADGAQVALDLVRVVGKGLVRRQHVVVGRDDADVGRLHKPDARLVGIVAGGEAVGQVAAG